MLKFAPVKNDKDLTPLNSVLLITGDGLSLPDDLQRFLEWQIDHDTMAIGRSINRFDSVRHWANVDAEDCRHWAENLPGKPLRHTMGDQPWFDVDWQIVGCEIDPHEIMWSGSTSLFASYIGLEMGYQRIVMAGCPLDKNGHWYFAGLAENTGPDWKQQSYDAWAEFAADDRSSRVRSFSGFTGHLLGIPDREWLNARTG